MPDDHELLSDWALRADESAFRALVNRYAGLVHGVAARRTGGAGRALAQEIGQNVFTMLARKAGSLRGHPCLASWLHRAAVLESAHLLRRECAHARKLDRLANHLKTMSSSPESTGPLPPGPELDDALAKLSESDRAVLLQRFFEDRSYREMAEMSGKNEAAIRKQIERALARLAPHLGKGTAAAVAAGTFGIASTLKAALTHAAPEGYALSAGTAAMAGAPALTFTQLLLHSIKIMTLGKSAFLTTAVLLALLTFGGSYAAARYVSASAAANSASCSEEPALAERAAGSANSRRGTALVKAGIPGDTPERAALRERLRLIGKFITVDLRNRNIAFGTNDIPSGGILRAMGEFDSRDLPAAWKMLADFRGRPKEYQTIASFLTSLRLETDAPRDVLEALLAPELRVDGEPPDFAMHEALAPWFASDPTAAFDWMMQAVTKGDFPFDRRIHYGSDLVEGWLGSDPVEALAALETLGPQWKDFRHAAIARVLNGNDGQEKLWPILEKADDRTALFVSDSHLTASDWTRDTVLPWLLSRNWSDGTTPERILHGWIWKDGKLDTEGLGMLCQAAGQLPEEASNDALLSSVRAVFGQIDPRTRTEILENSVKDPARREILERALNN